MIRTSTDRSFSKHIIIICVSGTVAARGFDVVVGNGGLALGHDSVLRQHGNGCEKSRKRHEWDKGKAVEAAGPGQGPSGHVVGVVVSLRHEVAGTEGPVGYSYISRSVERAELHPAYGMGVSGCEGIARVSKNLAEEDENVEDEIVPEVGLVPVVRVCARRVLCA